MVESRYVEVIGGEFQNKGAELMLHAVAERLRREELIPAISTRVGSKEQRRSVDAVGRLAIPRGDAVLRRATRLFPSALWDHLGFASDRRTAGTLDVSGFAYSDQWGEGSASYLARRARRSSDLGRPLVLLPQALGPFNLPGNRASIRAVLASGAIVYARDKRSYRNCVEAAGEHPGLRHGYDITIAVEPQPSAATPAEAFACFIPNARMLDKVATGDRDRYVASLAEGVDVTRRAGLLPVVVVHEVSRQDNELASALAERAGAEIRSERDPRRLKGLVGAASVVVSSRFHGLLAALSQGVPVVATAWSHKYVAILDDFGVAWLVVEDSGPLSIAHKLRALLETDLAQTRSVLEGCAEQMRVSVDGMWRDVLSLEW